MRQVIMLRDNGDIAEGFVTTEVEFGTGHMLLDSPEIYGMVLGKHRAAFESGQQVSAHVRIDGSPVERVQIALA